DAAVLNGLVAEAMRTRTAADWQPRLDAADLLYNKVNSYADLLADPHFQATRGVQWVEQPGVGRLPVAAIPAAARPGEGAAVEAPAIGADTRAVLALLGYA